MAKETDVLHFKDRLILLVIVLFLIGILFCSICLPINITILVSSFFLIFLMMLFLLIYIELGNFGKAKIALNYPSMSIVMPVYNSKNTIKQAINSIKNIDYPKKIEFIVVDDCSTDGSREYLETVKGIKLIKLKKNLGKADAMNEGLKHVKTELVACIDSDTYPEKDVFSKIVGYFENEKVGAVTCLILPDKKKNLIQKLQYYEYLLSFGLWTTCLSFIDSLAMIPGPMTIFRKKCFNEMGGYDSANLTEDMEIALRLQKFNYKIVSCYEAKAYTDIPDTLQKLIKQRDRWYRGRVFNLIKYKSLFFNKNNIDLGFFSLPYIFSLELISLVFLFRLIIMLLSNSFNFLLIRINLINYSDPFFVSFSSDFFSSINIFLFFSYLFIFIFTMIGLNLGNQKIKISDVPAIFLNILLFPLFVSTVYFFAFVKELFGVKGKWVRVST
ncbi:MAG: glycosyltransferase family 2 protein [Candidatus ainarchaeum sp.]|nr:glycosyltransferase family 2 protein [Candidatus ainarchaeum sp.]